MPVTQYKKVEKQFADRFGSWLRRIWVSILSFFKYIMQKGKQRFTVMLIPHSEKKIFNFQISFFTLIFVTCTLGVVLVGFFLLATSYTYTNEKIVKVSQDLQNNETTMENLKDEISGIRKAGRSFKASMDNVMRVIGNQDYLNANGTAGVSALYVTPERKPRGEPQGAGGLEEHDEPHAELGGAVGRNQKVISNVQGASGGHPHLVAAEGSPWQHHDPLRLDHPPLHSPWVSPHGSGHRVGARDPR